jgi:hypothetical protein
LIDLETPALAAGACEPKFKLILRVRTFEAVLSRSVEEIPRNFIMQKPTVRSKERIVILALIKVTSQWYWQEFPEYARSTATLIPGVKSWAANQVIAWLGFFLAAQLGQNCGEQCKMVSANQFSQDVTSGIVPA